MTYSGGYQIFQDHGDDGYGSTLPWDFGYAGGVDTPALAIMKMGYLPVLLRYGASGYTLTRVDERGQIVPVATLQLQLEDASTPVAVRRKITVGWDNHDTEFVPFATWIEVQKARMLAGRPEPGTGYWEELNDSLEYILTATEITTILARFEREYGMTSAEFLERLGRDAIDRSAETMLWEHLLIRQERSNP